MPLRFRHLLLAGALFLLVLIVYWPVRQFDFVNYDDDLYVYENANVSAGLTGQGLRWAFTAFHAANWHPLTWVSHMLDCDAFGLRAGGHHMTSVAWHGANAALLFLVLATCTGAFWTSGFVAALFAVHPAHVESVAWISERKDVLSTCFGLLAIGAYLEFAGVRGRGAARHEGQAAGSAPPHGRWGWYGAAVLAFALALLSKPMLVTLPALLILLDFWPLGRLGREAGSVRRALVEKWPFWFLSAGSVVLTVHAQWTAGAVRSLQHVPFLLRLDNALMSSVAYIGKLIWPHPLAVFYPFRRHVGGFEMAAALALLLAITTLVWLQRRHRPYLLMGWMWYGVTVAPVIGLVQVGNQAMADRYTYLPSIGLTLAVALLVREGWDRAWRRAAPHVRQLATYCGATVVILVLVAAVCVTRLTLAAWSGSIPLFEQALRVTRGNWLAHNNLAFACEHAGRVDQAIAHYHAAIQLVPDYVVARYNLGNLLTRLGRYAEAEVQFRAALQYAPRDARTLTNFGACLLAQGRPAEAALILREAIALDPQRPEAFNNLGNALAEVGDRDAAVAQYRASLRLDPEFSDARNNLGVALGACGDAAGAEREFRETIRRCPDSLEAYYNLGITLSQQGRTAEAVAAFQHVVAVAPGYAEAAARLAALQGAGALDGDRGGERPVQPP
ncbi:MAG: tetratricopeptide repeat protein [Lentisphaerae bacterium]|nr:tetratricopeptide repeat protein [Lentisphaerota bacterium]